MASDPRRLTGRTLARLFIWALREYNEVEPIILSGGLLFSSSIPTPTIQGRPCLSLELPKEGGDFWGRAVRGLTWPLAPWLPTVGAGGRGVCPGS